MTTNNEDWLKLAIQGDTEAFSNLVETYQTPVYNLCSRMLGNAEDAEDAAQEAFWRAYQNLKRYDPNRSFVTWLLSIAAHYCIDQQRKKRLPAVDMETLPEEVIPDNLPTPEHITFSRNASDGISGVLAKLNPDDRVVIILKYWYDYSEAEIAETMGITPSAAKSRLFRARRQVAAIMTETNPELVTAEFHHE